MITLNTLITLQSKTIWQFICSLESLNCSFRKYKFERNVISLSTVREVIDYSSYIKNIKQMNEHTVCFELLMFLFYSRLILWIGYGLWLCQFLIISATLLNNKPRGDIDKKFVLYKPQEVEFYTKKLVLSSSFRYRNLNVNRIIISIFKRDD